MNKYQKRIEKVEAKLGEAGKLPLSARGPFIVWPDPGEKADFSEIEARLMKRFGTCEGAKFISISWGSPDEGNAAESDGDIKESIQGCYFLTEGWGGDSVYRGKDSCPRGMGQRQRG